MSYPWPGNIRELENIMERTFLFADKRSIIDVGDLPPDLQAKIFAEASAAQGGLKARATSSADHDGSMKDIVRQATAELERDLNQKALDDTNGNVTHAARKLKISRKSLQIKMKELGLREQAEAKVEPGEQT